MKKLLLSGLALIAFSAQAQAVPTTCKDLPDHKALQAALKEARGADNGGLNLDMWGTVVDRSGLVCAVVYTGEKVDSQWPGSRVISAQKANTANGLSLDKSAFSTANLYAATQPGGFMFGLQESNPVNVAVAYKGPATAYGSLKDPLVGQAIGGINVFGGGLALYNDKGQVVGGLGVSGDTSCADHNIAWRARHALKLDYVTSGVSPDKNDNIVYDLDGTKSDGGFGHPTCGGKENDIAEDLPAINKVAETPADAKETPQQEKK